MTEEAAQQSSTGQSSSGGPRGPEGLFTNADAIPKARPSTPGAIALAPGSVPKPYDSHGRRLDRRNADDEDTTMTQNWDAASATDRYFQNIKDKQLAKKQPRQRTPEGADSASSSQWQQLDSSGSRRGERPSAGEAAPISGEARGSSSAAGPDTAAGGATTTGSLVEALSDGRSLRRRGNDSASINTMPLQSKAAPPTSPLAPADFRIRDSNYRDIQSRTFRSNDDGWRDDRRNNHDRSSTNWDWGSGWRRHSWHE